MYRSSVARTRRTLSGFTLIEVVVVVAIVALLSAILTPIVAQKINDSRISKAQNETAVIAAAIADFYKDVAAFPAMDSSGQLNKVKNLLSGPSVPTTSPFTGGNGGWFSTSPKDTMDNHLVKNTPQGSTSNIYSTSGSERWKGPYMEQVPLDPWARPYVCNIRAVYDTSSSKYRKCLVMSAGPDGVFQTDDDALFDTKVLGDDIGFLVHLR
jgi:prepilin-type N-terminal cleavage/methylation domain-containing protein